MIRLFLLGLISFTGATIFAQSNLSIQSNKKIIGSSYLTNDYIEAKEYVFPEKISDTYLDTITNYITVQLRGTSKNGKWLKNKGRIVLYDLIQKKEKWSKRINYQQSAIEQHNDLIIQTIANKSYCLDFESGKEQWEVKNAIYYVEPFQKKGIGYKFNTFSGPTNTLEGIDLNDGKSIWQREINREYSWNDIFHLNDTTLVIVASGLHSINVKTGKGWDYNTITGEKDYTATAVANVAGVALGVLTGTFVMSTGNNLVRDVVSNVLVDSTNLYFASKEKIARLDHNGLIIWSSPLPANLVSKSSIFIKDSLLYMVNKGYAYMGYRQLDFGNAFIAAFDKKTGKQVFLNVIGGKRSHINGFKIQKDSILFVFKDKISKYSMVNGSLISEKSIDIQQLGELSYFIGNQLYIKSDSIFKSLTLSDPANHYLFTKKDKILVVNDKFETINQINRNQLFKYYLNSKGFKFLAKGNETIVIDQDNKAVANLKVSSKTIMVGPKLYNIQEKSFIEIDISEIIKDNKK
jgi:hypothetical protein